MRSRLMRPTLRTGPPSGKFFPALGPDEAKKRAPLATGANGVPSGERALPWLPLMDRSSHLREVAAVFLKLGFIAFGGPAAHIALMRQEVVERRRWLSDQRFLDLFGACNLIPGPSSTELAIMLGYERAGPPALVLAGVLFIAPAMAIVLVLAWAYV